MTYNLQFLPEVEEDVISGHFGMKRNPEDSGKTFFVCSMPVQMKFHGIHYVIPKFIGTFEGGCSGDFRTPFILL